MTKRDERREKKKWRKVVVWLRKGMQRERSSRIGFFPPRSVKMQRRRWKGGRLDYFYLMQKVNRG